jgi:hypothetical protein
MMKSAPVAFAARWHRADDLPAVGALAAADGLLADVVEAAQRSGRPQVRLFDQFGNLKSWIEPQGHQQSA